MAYLEGKEFGHADLILLDKVTEEAVSDNLKLRFSKGKVIKVGDQVGGVFLYI
jgi:hypothetical protein